MNGYLRTRDVADLLNVSCETILRWHRSGRLPGGHRLNGSNVLRFDADELQVWLSTTRTEHTTNLGSDGLGEVL